MVLWFPMRIFDAATSAASALSWYHLPQGKQYVGENGQLYDDLATLCGREEYAERIADATSNVEGRVLEIGAGTGIVSKALAHRHGERLLCSDVEPAALALNTHAHTCIADCRDLPFADGSFDAVVGVGVYRYIHRKTTAAFWSEMHRVVKQSGKLVLGEFHPRIIGVRGSKLGKATMDELFSLETWSLHPSHIKIGEKILRTGEYHTYVFQSV
jgi:ubiquinone/menaquinone biosynthesis C-methylase UbiE